MKMFLVIMLTNLAKIFFYPIADYDELKKALLIIVLKMLNIKKIAITAFLLMVFLPAAAQIDNTPFFQVYQLQPQDSNKVFLEISALGFTKNNEYFNRIADGYTLFGYQATPAVTYQPLKNFAITGGAYFRKDFGSEGFFNVEPVFRFTYHRDSLQVIFGTLNGALTHRLIEPLYDFDRFLATPLENGLQVRYFKKSWFADFWIDWQRMIYEGDPFQEEVTGGLSLEKEFQLNEISLFIPLQLLVYHKGGQIDTAPNPLETFWNSAVGFRLEKTNDQFIKQWQASFYYLFYKDFSNTKLQPFENGQGYYLNGSLMTDFDLQVMLSYWKGREFISIMGGQLYPSVSSVFKNPDRVEQERELLLLRFSHNIHIYKGISLISRFDPYYDLQNETFEFSHGLYINYKQKIPLIKKVLK